MTGVRRDREGFLSPTWFNALRCYGERGFKPLLQKHSHKHIAVKPVLRHMRVTLSPLLPRHQQTVCPSKNGREGGDMHTCGG